MPSMGRVAEIQSVLDSGYTAREYLGRALTMFHSAYELTDSYQVGPLGSGQAAQNRTYLDGIRIRAEADYSQIPESNDPLPDQQAKQVAFDIASMESAMGQTLDLMGGSSALGELGTSIADAGASIVESATKAVAGGIPWWIWLLLVAVGVSIFAMKVRA